MHTHVHTYKNKNKKQGCIENLYIPINMNVSILHLYLSSVYLYAYVFYCACVMWERSHAVTLGWRSEDSSVKSVLLFCGFQGSGLCTSTHWAILLAWIFVCWDQTWLCSPDWSHSVRPPEWTVIVPAFICFWGLRVALYSPSILAIELHPQIHWCF